MVGSSRGQDSRFSSLPHGFESRTDYKHINLSTHTADGGLSKIQFRTAGSRMLESVLIVRSVMRHGAES